MNASRAPRPPGKDEFDDFYAGYVGLVPDRPVLEVLREQLASTRALLSAIPSSKQDFRYAPAKWSIKEVVGHIVDTEWVFTYRALRIARNDKTPLPGMDQDQFMDGANFAKRDLPSLVEELFHLRSANLALFESFDEEILDRAGTASDCPFTVRALLHIIAGHQIHHINVLKERYL
jgi:hypothetical protein